jgi:hypothetical protein
MRRQAVSNSPINGPSRAGLTTRFNALVRQWKDETTMHSSTSRIVNHPAYQSIIAMGRPAVPLILQELSRDPAYWFEALRTITNEDPVPAGHRGRIEAMTADWLAWGRARGLN